MCMRPQRERAVAEVDDLGRAAPRAAPRSRGSRGCARARSSSSRELAGSNCHWSRLLRLQSTWTSQPRSRSPLNSRAKNVSENFGKWSVTSTTRPLPPPVAAAPGTLAGRGSGCPARGRASQLEQSAPYSAWLEQLVAVVRALEVAAQLAVVLEPPERRSTGRRGGRARAPSAAPGARSPRRRRPGDSRSSAVLPSPGKCCAASPATRAARRRRG